MSEHPNVDALMGPSFFEQPRHAGSAWGRTLALVAAGLVLLVFMANAVLLVLSMRKPAPYAPLGDYPTQRIEMPLEGPEGNKVPTVHYSPTTEAVVAVRALKCNNADYAVPVTGFSQWKLVDPPGTFVDGSKGQTTRKVGCEQFSYRNPLPPGVRERLEQLHRNGLNETLWQMVGQETPVSPEGQSGVIRFWQSENFRIVYDVPAAS